MLSRLIFKTNINKTSQLLNKSLRFNSEDMVTITCRDALYGAMAEEMKLNENVFIMGEEVGQYKGAYKVTQNLVELYGTKRVWETPITEQGFTGLGIGAAMMGLRPVIEFMTMNFALQAIDQIMNSCAKTRYMSGGEIECPIVFRGLNGPAAAVAAQHSQCFASMYANCPGLRVVSCYDIEDCRGLLKASIRDPNPVIFLENELMYGKSFEVPQRILEEDFLVSLDKAKIMREGNHVTITAFSRMVALALEAADVLAKEGISAEVINLRSIRPLDRDTILKSVAKTNRLITCEDGYPQHGVGAEICAFMMESSGFDLLDAPVERVTAWDIPLPYASNLETAALPQVEHIVKAVRRATHGAKL